MPFRAGIEVQAPPFDCAQGRRSRRNAAARAAVLLAAICAFFLPRLAAEEPTAIRWYKDLDRATAAARETNRPLYLDFWADWCAACRVMEKEVYTDPGVIEAASKKFLPVQIDFDRQEKLARKYNVTGLPTIVVADSFGGELFRYSGFVESKTLIELLKALPGDISEINRLRQVLAQNKDNLDALAGLGNHLRAAGLFRASNDYYARALKTEPAKHDARQREQLLMAMGQNLLELREAKEAARVFERCRREFPASENQPSFLLGLGQAHALAGAHDKASKSFDALVSQYPQSEAAGKVPRSAARGQ